MNESEFEHLAEETINTIEDAVEASPVDIDYDNAGGILTLEFTSGSQIIINKQAPLKQIWVAARCGGFHFDFDDDKKNWSLSSGDELFDCLSRYCTEQAGEAVELVA